MSEILIATNNKHKIEEIKPLLPVGIKLMTLSDFKFEEDIPETGDTLIDNALQKARFIHERFNVDCFADDTGLEIDALDGRPGVYSARYAGPQCSPKDNVEKVLEEMNGMVNRKARFITVIALIYNNQEFLFEGRVEGEMLTTIHGEGGFGYDPIFLPEGQYLSFAEMPLEMKNRISHRALAVAKLVEFLGRDQFRDK
jgi:XTP/dITP diphosphohydrolase